MTKVSNDTRPVTIYNCGKQEPIGVFVKKVLAGKYLFNDSQKGARKVCNHMRYQSKFIPEVFDFPVTLRYANESQVEKLNGNEYVIYEGYPEPSATKMKGFTSSRFSMAEEHTRKYKQ